MDKERFLKYLRGKVEGLRSEREHAIVFHNYGKAAVIDGELTGTLKVIRQIELGDFDKCEKT